MSVPLHVSGQFPIFYLWLTYFTVVGDPPYPGFRGCFLTHAANLDLILFWVGVIIWDTRTSKSVLYFLSSDRKAVMLVLMLIPGVRACEKS
jgi:hypothetical protein